MIVLPFWSFFGDFCFHFIIGLKAEAAHLWPLSVSGSGDSLFQPPPPMYFKTPFPPLFPQSGLLFIIAFSLMCIQGVDLLCCCCLQQNPHFINGCFKAKQRQTPLFLSLFPGFGSNDRSLMSGKEKSLCLFLYFSADLKSSPIL